MSQTKKIRVVDEESRQRLAKTCEMMQEMLDNMSLAQRDRMRQTNLAAARGPANNFKLLCEMTDALRELRASKKQNDEGDRQNDL